MQNDPLMAMWDNIGKQPADQEKLKSMIAERTYPVRRKIRLQMIIEITGFALLLLVYYDFFDGHQKPLYGNVALVSGLLLAISYNIVGYRLAGKSVPLSSITTSLEQSLNDLRRYSRLSILIRILTAVCLLTFFCSVIIFTTGKYLLLIAIVLVFANQIFLLSRLWSNRIARLKATFSELTSEL
ncbi:hypothetical protein [Chitinophaga rhizophila]|uniref:Uncharacterized protein n=1 Tax=Chitinophaga rhizophila TaxID=2866212 RepID=A0ABS7G5X5_9BACT|nr:hypothetical protein [Chitinophaga rhizophila]MBW8682710.1 hypothetical protein [Chitinophaga rhizophila]